ncbi:unnamed protein product, partial [Dicrocoelium dendriticum]
MLRCCTASHSNNKASGSQVRQNICFTGIDHLTHFDQLKCVQISCYWELIEPCQRTLKQSKLQSERCTVTTGPAGLDDGVTTAEKEVPPELNDAIFATIVQVQRKQSVLHELSWHQLAEFVSKVN